MAESQKSLEQTPTWAVAAVCTVFVVASLVVERGIKYLGNYLKKTKQKKLYHTLEQIKDELMLLGFISLSLTVFQSKIASLCMPERLNTFMLPCKHKATDAASVSGSAVTCPAGKVQVISVEGLHQLHIFIFVMAVVHVIYSAFTVLFGLWQVHRWNRWEVETQRDQVKCVNKALNGRHVVDTFLTGRIRFKFLHTSRTGLNLDSYVYNFFRQFGKPIYKADYLCLRYGFIAHHQLGSTFDFHSYIKRTMETDFQIVVGISWYLWAFVCIYLLVDIEGWYSYFWLAFIPTIMVLIVGTKLQQIITCLALEVRGGVQKIRCGKDSVESCTDKRPTEVLDKCPEIRPRDDLFWFCRPRLLLYLVHFILFQNAFELAFFFWTVFTYGYKSCLVGRTWMVIVRILVGFFVQVLCSVSTLPLYALVTQLGSTIKFTVFKSEATATALRDWRKMAQKKHREPGHVHEYLTPREEHLGIVGLNKALNEHGRPVNIAHPGTHGIRPHNGEVHHTDEHGHYHADPQPEDGSHTVDILGQPQRANTQDFNTGPMLLGALRNKKSPPVDNVNVDEERKF